jgi:hypothetical protein
MQLVGLVVREVVQKQESWVQTTPALQVTLKSAPHQ